MTKVKFSRYERVAGLFVLTALIGVFVSAFSVAIKRGWFEPQVRFSTTFENAEGLHAGAAVKMAGLNAGSIESVELLKHNHVRVNFFVMKKFSNKIRKDSLALLVRPFVIGDRVLEITVGSEDAAELPENSIVASEESLDIMTVFSGKKMNQALTKMGSIAENMQTLLEAFSDKNRTQSLVRMFDQMDPLLANMNKMSEEVVKMTKQINKDNQLPKLLKNATLLTGELNLILPEVNKFNPQMGHDLAKLTKSLGQMSAEMETAMNDLGPDGKSSAKRAFEALNEATVLMKALQKSFFLRSSVLEVRQEEKQRLPASHK
jgi:phospholipid/cholesterol/gamma-HCH transport system substrate-binding protein